MKIKLPIEVVNKVLAYLDMRPHREVAALIKEMVDSHEMVDAEIKSDPAPEPESVTS